MERSKDVITWQEWAGDRNVVHDVRKARKRVLDGLAEANGKGQR
jgi:hypothetical protein